MKNNFNSFFKSNRPWMATSVLVAVLGAQSILSFSQASYQSSFLDQNQIIQSLDHKLATSIIVRQNETYFNRWPSSAASDAAPDAATATATATAPDAATDTAATRVTTLQVAQTTTDSAQTPKAATTGQTAATTSPPATATSTAAPVVTQTSSTNTQASDGCSSGNCSTTAQGQTAIQKTNFQTITEALKSLTEIEKSDLLKLLNPTQSTETEKKEPKFSKESFNQAVKDIGEECELEFECRQEKLLELIKSYKDEEKKYNRLSSAQKSKEEKPFKLSQATIASAYAKLISKPLARSILNPDVDTEEVNNLAAKLIDDTPEEYEFLKNSIAKEVLNQTQSLATKINGQFTQAAQTKNNPQLQQQIYQQATKDYNELSQLNYINTRYLMSAESFTESESFNKYMNMSHIPTTQQIMQKIMLVSAPLNTTGTRDTQTQNGGFRTSTSMSSVESNTNNLNNQPPTWNYLNQNGNAVQIGQPSTISRGTRGNL